MAKLPDNVKEILQGGHNVWVATIGEDGWPNVAIKGSGALLDDEHDLFCRHLLQEDPGAICSSTAKWRWASSTPRSASPCR